MDHPAVVMGVSGSGKTTAGEALAQRLGVPFEDGDDLHPQANVDKMSRGEPLDDDDRRPWLDLVGAWLAAHPDGGFVACSALKRAYRDQLRGHAPDVEFVFLHGSRETIKKRQAARGQHFMPPSLVDSQFDTLEPLADDERHVRLDVERSVEELVDDYVAAHEEVTS